MEHKTEVITIAKDGTITGMYSDTSIVRDIPGHLSVERVTNIVFCGDPSLVLGWTILPCALEKAGVPANDMPFELKGFADYEQARQFEIAWVNLCGLAGIALEEDTVLYLMLRDLLPKVAKDGTYEVGEAYKIAHQCDNMIRESTGNPRQYLMASVVSILDSTIGKAK